MAEETALAPSIFVVENVSSASSSESLNVVDDGPDLLIGKHPLKGWHWTVHTLSTTLSNDLVQILAQVVTRERKTNFDPDPIEWARCRAKGQLRIALTNQAVTARAMKAKERHTFP